MQEFFTAIEPDRQNKTPIAHGIPGVSCLRDERSLTHPLLDLLGIEWILSNRVLSLPILEDHTPPGPPPHRLYRRTSCLPRATFLTEAVILADPEQRLQRLGSREHQPHSIVVLQDENARPAAGGEANAGIKFRYHRDEEVALQVTTTMPGYLRLADPYDPGWTVTVNGKPEQILVADHYLRAVYLPAGEHELVFRYNGATVGWPRYLSLMGLLLLVVGSGLASWRPRLLDGKTR